jgi:hypothetical protein
VAYTDPEVAWVGLTEDEAKKQGIKIEKGVFPWAASGRAIANGRDEGFTKLIFDAETHRILGGSIVGTHAGDLISELALAVEMGADVVDIAKTIHPHPTLGESVGMAAEAGKGSGKASLAVRGLQACVLMREPSVASTASTGSDCISVKAVSACALSAFFSTRTCTSCMRFASCRARAVLTVLLIDASMLGVS